jgi:hypothetical protein
MFFLLVLAVIALVSLATTSPITERTASYGVTVPTFIISHQGQEIKLRGTIEEVIDQVESRHPGYLANLTARINENSPSRVELGLETRNKQPPPLCSPNPAWQYANPQTIYNSAQVLLRATV